MEENLLKNRAWVEINLNNLTYNIKEIKKLISKKTKIMAVIKANAYGHGLIKIAEKCHTLGIDDYAVATLEEGITLRKNNLTGNILILGYTSPEFIKYVIKYDLIQTVVDENYAKALLALSFDKKVKVHLKINTGMNRLGINYKHTDFIKNLYQSNKLTILGIFSHLSVADSLDPSDITFTQNQIANFNNLLNELKSCHINVGKTHLQSSYGILNYSNLEYDYVRVGIIMYGIHSEKKLLTKAHLNLRPVLSLKARITSIRELSKGESVGYGRKYMSKSTVKIATVSIGYADGYPRALSCKNVKVLVNGKYAKIIGRICMDQLILEVTNIPDLHLGDIVTLIGSSKPIKAESLAAKSNTITNELLSRLGARLNYLYIDK